MTSRAVNEVIDTPFSEAPDDGARFNVIDRTKRPFITFVSRDFLSRARLFAESIDENGS